MNVITIGGATRDLFIVPADQSIKVVYDESVKVFSLSSPRDKIAIKSIMYQSGGGATNSAVSFARQGLSTTCITSIGNDSDGASIKKELKQEQVNTSALITTENVSTGQSFIIHQPPGSKHILFVDRGANEHLSLATINRDLIATSDLLYITSLDKQATEELPDLCSFAQNHGVKIAHNPGQWELTTGISSLIRILPTLEILIVNHQEARQLETSLNPKTDLASNFNIEQFLQKIHTLGVTTIVVTHGKHGVYVSQKDCIFFHPSLPTDVINTVGAGDSFGSVFSAAILQNNDLDGALIKGLISSRSVIGQVGAKKGLLTGKQLQKLITDFDSTLLQKIKPLS